MAIKREPPTAADVIVMALSPVLIMSLVGSLVFFLAEVFYAGQYQGRLQYTLFFFVVGAVLVGRVAVTVDRTRAWLYGGFLALVTFIALRVWVDYPEDSPMTPLKDLINAILIGVVWWSSNRLCWDCTFIDENRPGSGKGLLAAAGWEKRPGIRPDVVEDIQEDERRYPAGMQGWYRRFDQWQKSRSKKPHTPGLTVVYFSLAALPIFGLGQTLIPADDSGRRAYTFWLAAAYVGSGLGLLLTTSFLGLRRYLRQRKLKMPGTMTATWMGLGAVLILAFILVGALLPRPYSESPPWNPMRALTKDRNASDYAVNSDSGGKGSGRTGEQATKGDGEATGKGGEPGAKGKDGDAKKGSGEKDGKDGGGGEKSDGNKNGEKGDPSKGEKSQDGKESGRQASGSQKQANKSGSNAADRLQNSSVGNAFSKIANVLKWIVFAVLAIVVVFFVFRNGLQFLSNFMPWAKNLLAAIDAWLKGLFGGREPKETQVRAETKVEEVDMHVPFTAFSNPFADGTADGRSPDDLVRYSFEALEAWASDRDRERRDDETAIEFAQRLGEDFAWLREDSRKLSLLVARMVYASGNLPKNTKDTLDHFWDRITSGAVEPGVEEEVEFVE
ncbi:MAG TPA: hypothetical protein VHR66_32650 [Gemmataceae bacterium]|jgi:hypothetical protein|nr:hypothetical protein [Gemmataceae bacterium]